MVGSEMIFESSEKLWGTRKHYMEETGKTLNPGERDNPPRDGANYRIGGHQDNRKLKQ